MPTTATWFPERQACAATNFVFATSIATMLPTVSSGRSASTSSCSTSTAQVARIFGPDVPLVLEVIPNPEAVDALPELFLYIQTRLPVHEARARLEKLDDEWWLDALPGADGRLNIALEYV